MGKWNKKEIMQGMLFKQLNVVQVFFFNFKYNCKEMCLFEFNNGNYVYIINIDRKAHR